MRATLGGLTIAAVIGVMALAGCTSSMSGDAMSGDKAMMKGDGMKKGEGMMEKK
jgi:outer membrane murein-binding lipoprotein Lpp